MILFCTHCTLELCKNTVDMNIQHRNGQIIEKINRVTGRASDEEPVLPVTIQNCLPTTGHSSVKYETRKKERHNYYIIILVFPASKSYQ